MRRTGADFRSDQHDDLCSAAVGNGVWFASLADGGDAAFVAVRSRVVNVPRRMSAADRIFSFVVPQRRDACDWAVRVSTIGILEIVVVVVRRFCRTTPKLSHSWDFGM